LLFGTILKAVLPMKHIIIAILLISAIDTQVFAQPERSSNSHSQEAVSDFTVSTDSKTGHLVFKGRVTPEDLGKEPTFKWYQKGIADYTPDPETMEYLQAHLSEYDVLVFMGTWCEDSHIMIPKLMRVLNDAGYKGNLTMYGVERNKNTRSAESRKYDIGRIPVVILLKDGKEVGRMTENIVMTVEDDLVKVMRP
jgi:thiol-disulfide isomerase/thioredoxin